MKSEEDEAFDELARRQGMWGGGFPAKRAMAADKLHWSDCAVHNGPAYPAGECDCGVEKEQEDWGVIAEKQLASIKRDTQASFEDATVRATHKVMSEFEAQPAQEPVAKSFEEYCKTLHPLWNTHISRTYAEQFFNAGQTAQPAQEPTGMLHIDRLGQWLDASLKERKRPWVGLTDEEVELYWDWEDWQTGAGRSTILEMVRDIEAKLRSKNT
jgi:hypothetical protein